MEPKVTWHWHMHQPIYWNDQSRLSAIDRYEYAWESIQLTDGGDPHPMNNLRDIFGKDDRVAAYQYRMRDSLAGIGGHLNSGAAISYSGALMENVRSLGEANQLGYGADWSGWISEANGWTTTGGQTRMDIMNFSFHHALMGLHNPETVYMELRLHQEIVKQVFGEDALSRGYFPSEMTFSTRQLPTLKRLGIEWAIVSGEHIARACPDFPVVLGSGGVNCAPPNRADQINPPGGEFIRVSIDRGCSPVHANPLSYQPAFTQYVDPETGEIHKLIVVPADMSQGWRDGYSCIDASFLDALKDRNDPAHPSLVLLSHDGDNAFGGGFSYYNECVPNLANDASARGGEPTSIEQYLADFPPDPNIVIHVEDGGWAYADSDFGSPTYINWNYPLLSANGEVDPVNGWHEKPRDMAIFTETLNRVLTAEQIAGREPDFTAILRPEESTHPVDRAWHYYLGSLDSGNVYFGPALDLEVKATLGCNEAVEHADPLIGDASQDQTPPTIWLPQRFPYNPGGRNYGVEFGYREVFDDGDFHIWTFIGEVSRPVTATLKYRVDNDGVNPLDSTDNETYAGGSEVGAWQSLSMNGRDFPKGMPADYTNGAIDLWELPTHIATHHSVEVVGLRDTLIDYYVEATDARGNTSRSPIQHVYIGDGSGSGGDGEGVSATPDPPVRGQSVTIRYDATARPLDGLSPINIHHGQNGWDPAITTAPGVAMTEVEPNIWEYSYIVAGDAETLDMAFNHNNDPWDNNVGQDYHFDTTGGTTSPTLVVNPTPIAETAAAGAAPFDATITIQNGGGGALAYQLSVEFPDRPVVDDAEIYGSLLGRSGIVEGSDRNADGMIDIADLLAASPAPPGWLIVAPTAGDSQGEADPITLTFDPAGLSSGTHSATIRVAANAANAPQSVEVSLTVQSGEVVPSETSVVPNPPTAGESVRVWYRQAGGPLDGAASLTLHWGVNGPDEWQNVTDTPLTPSGDSGMWSADLVLPTNATQLNFAVNDGQDNWDNNNSQNWNYDVNVGN